MKNNTLSEIAQKLSEANTIFLFPHMRVDGDALGSCMALCLALCRQGKQAQILIEDEIPQNLLFLTEDKYITTECHVSTPDLCIAVDCSDPTRFEKRQSMFDSAACKICIDHHETTCYFADYNYIDPVAAATGQIIFDLLKAMNVTMDQRIANALYTALATDTGNFSYSNTTRRTHEIVAELYDHGLDNSYVCNEVYGSVRQEQIAIHSIALSSMKVFSHGKAAMTCVTQDMLQKTGAKLSETDGIVEKMRNICGVEISALLKEEDEKTVKVSLRAKTTANVAELAQQFGGGGHKKAAGCTIRKPLEEAKKEIEEAICATLCRR